MRFIRINTPDVRLVFTCIMLVVLPTACLPAQSDLRKQQESAREIISKTGGSTFGFGNNKIGVDFRGDQLRTLDGLSEIPDLASIRFFDANLSETHLSRLVSLKQVVEISILNSRTTRTAAGFGYAQITDTGIALLEAMPQLEKLELDNVPITDKSLETIAKLPSLKSLRLFNLRVSPSSFRLLRNRQLKSIAVGGPLITDEIFDGLPLDQIEEFSIGECYLDLSRLRYMPHLTSLGVGTSQYRRGDLAILAELENLTRLRLNCPVDDNALESVQVKELVIHSDRTTDACIATISRMPKLTFLELRGTQYTAKAWSELANCQKLAELVVMATSMSNADLAVFAKFPALQRLSIHSAKRVSDRGIQNLAKASQLRQISLHMTSVSKSGAKKLERLLPDCNIHWHN
jgi:internalin A